MRPSRTMHSSSATEDTASITSSEGPSRNRLASIGRASVLPICPRAHAADLATMWFRSWRRSIITAMSSGRRQAQRQALARMSGSACRRRDRKTSTGRVACSCAATVTARPSVGPCTTPARSIGIQPAPHHDCRSRRVPAELQIVPGPRDQYQNRQNVGRAPKGGMAAASRRRAASAARSVQSARFAAWNCSNQCLVAQVHHRRETCQTLRQCLFHRNTGS